MKIKPLFAAVAVLAVLVGCGGSSEADEAPTKGATGATAGPAEDAEAPEPDPEAELVTAIEKAAKGAEVELDGGDVVVQFPIGDNITQGMIRTGAQRATVDILKAIKESGHRGGDVYARIGGTFTMVDEYGNESDDEVVYALYFPETLEKINVDNVDSDNIWNLADERVIHPEFQD